MRKPILILAIVWLAAFAIALLLDSHLAQWVHDSGLAHRVEGSTCAQILKTPGNFSFTFAVLILLILTKQIRWQQAGFVVLVTAISGLHVFLKWTVGRTRPYKLTGQPQPRPFELHPFRDGLYGFFHQTNLSFPSGHACIAAALAAAIAIVWPKGFWLFALLAFIVGLERIAENAHYFSDVIGAFGFGVLSLLIVHRIFPRWAKPADRMAS